MEKQAKSKEYYQKHKVELKAKRTGLLDGIEDKVKEMELKPNTKKAYLDNLARVRKVFPSMQLNKSQPMVNAIRESKYSIATKRVMLAAILWAVTKLELKVKTVVMEELKHAYNVMKVESGDQLRERMATEVVPSWDEYLTKVKAEFGSSSREYLLAKLYQAIPSRDDFQLKVTDKMPEDDKTNWIVITPKSVIVVLNVYKTRDSYGQKRHKLSSELAKMVRAYLKGRSGEYLFGNEKQSPFISAMNKRIGYKGGSNFMRHLAVTDAANGTAEERATLAETMGHSTETAPSYKRQQESS